MFYKHSTEHATTLNARVKPGVHLSHNACSCVITALRRSVLSRSDFGRKPAFVSMCSFGFGDVLLCRSSCVYSVCMETIKVRTLAGPWKNSGGFSLWSSVWDNKLLCTDVLIIGLLFFFIKLVLAVHLHSKLRQYLLNSCSLNLLILVLCCRFRHQRESSGTVHYLKATLQVITVIWSSYTLTDIAFHWLSVHMSHSVTDRTLFVLFYPKILWKLMRIPRHILYHCKIYAHRMHSSSVPVHFGVRVCFFCTVTIAICDGRKLKSSLLTFPLNQKIREKKL